MSSKPHSRPLPLFLKPLNEPLFRSLWIANLISNIGTWMQQMGAAWLMASLSGSALMVSLVQTANTLPMFFIAIPAGVWGDIWDKRKVLLFTQVFMALSALALGIMVWFGKVGPWGLIFFVFLMAAGSAMNMPAWQSASSALMKDPSDLPQMASLNNMSFNLGRCIGPAAAGFLFTLVGASWLFLLNAFSFIGVIWVFFKWSRVKEEIDATKSNFWGAFLEGWNACKTSIGFKNILIRSFCFFFFGTAMWSLLPLIAKKILLLEANGFGFMMTSLGVGAVTAAILLPYIRKTHSPTQVVERATLLYLFSSGLLVKSAYFPVACLLLVACGMAWAAMVSQLNSAAQMVFPIKIRSRALSLYFFVFYFALAIGSVVFGKIAELLGIPLALWLASLGLFISLPLLKKVKI